MSSEAMSHSRTARRARRSVRGIQRSRLLVSVTSSERALIEEGARLRGVSLSRFVVEAALHPVTTSEGIAGPSHAEELIELLRAYRRQLEGAMTNLNQIAHHANTLHEVPENFASVVSSVADTIEDITLASMGYGDDSQHRHRRRHWRAHALPGGAGARQ